MSSVWSNRSPSSDEMRRTQNFELGAVRRSFLISQIPKTPLTSIPFVSALSETAELRW